MKKLTPELLDHLRELKAWRDAHDLREQNSTAAGLAEIRAERRMLDNQMKHPQSIREIQA